MGQEFTHRRSWFVASIFCDRDVEYISSLVFWDCHGSISVCQDRLELCPRDVDISDKMAANGVCLLPEPLQPAECRQRGSDGPGDLGDAMVAAGGRTSRSMICALESASDAANSGTASDLLCAIENCQRRADQSVQFSGIRQRPSQECIRFSQAV
jgi:hypothetical protein